jgi:ATP-dependent DNA helicase RecG
MGRLNRIRPFPDQIAIYQDRVEIRSPGGLLDGLTEARLLEGGISRRRNPLVADLLRRVHLVEAWGRGMPLILEKAPNVVFEDAAGMFIARFARVEKPESGPESILNKVLMALTGAV